MSFFPSRQKDPKKRHFRPKKSQRVPKKTQKQAVLSYKACSILQKVVILDLLLLQGLQTFCRPSLDLVYRI